MRLGGIGTFVDFARVVAVPVVWRRRVAAGLVSTLAITLTPLVPSAAEPPPEGTPVTAAAMVKDFHAMGGSIIDMVDVGGRAFFVGRTAEHGEELWTSDGTTEGTRLVKDIWAGPANYHAYPVTGVGVQRLNEGRSAVIDDVLYFVAEDGSHGGTLWRSDGTAAGTRMVKDVVPESTQGNEVWSMGAAGATLFFIVSTGDVKQLWTSDGTADGTVKVADVGTGSIGRVVALGNEAVFVAGNQSNGELWHSDGTAAGTGPLGGPTIVRQLTVAGDHVYFTAGEGGYEHLWRTDGTPDGTERVPGDARAGDFVDLLTGLTDVDGELFYMVNYLSDSQGKDFELRRVGATGTGTLVKGIDFMEGGGNLWEGTGSALAVGGSLYFIPKGSSASEWYPGQALWRSDGTSAGTDKVSSEPVYHLAEAAGRAYYATASADNRWRVKRLSATGTESELVAGPFTYPFGQVDFVMPYMADVGGAAFFAGNDDLWKIGEDATNPQTMITDGFADGEIVTSYPDYSRTFTFGVVDDFTPAATATFEVKLDDQPWYLVSSSYNFEVAYREGEHTILARAVDAAGRVDPTPASRTFTIDLEPEGPLFNDEPPRISGTPRLASTLTATAGVWSPDPDQATYQWLRGGTPITGATERTYKVVLADVGRDLRVREQTTAPGYTASAATSQAVRVARVASSTRLTLKKYRVPARSRATAVVRVRTGVALPVTGRVTVLSGVKRVGAATLVNGTATIRLARLPRGAYRLKAKFAGNVQLNGSASAIVRLVVTR